MILAVLLTLKLFSSAAIPVQTSFHKVGPWRMEVRQDNFSNQVACRVRAEHMELHHETLVLHLGRRTDTSRALVRIDGGAPIAFHGPDFRLPPFSDLALANPTGGIVEVPVARLTGVRHLAVESSPGRPVQTFDIAGLAQVQAAAASSRCWRSATPLQVVTDTEVGPSHAPKL